MRRTASLSGLAELTSPEHRLITVIGAGGKTSLVGWLAEQKQMSDQRVIITTTTKIFPPRDVCIVLQDNGPDFFGRLYRALCKHGCVTAARRYDEKSGKLIGLDCYTVTLMHDSGMADAIIVEADGAAHKSLKAPAAHEPVIPLASDICIGIMGLDAIQRPLNEANVHRHEIFSKITRLAPGAPITPKHMVRIATAPNGLFKGTPPDSKMAILLNKSDIPGGLGSLEEFTAILNKGDQSMNFKWYAGSIRQRRIVRITPSLCESPCFSNNRLEFSHQF